MSNQEEDYAFYDLFVPLTTKKAITFLCILGFILYFYGLANGFVADDPPEIVYNTIVHSLSNLPQFFSGGLFYMGEGQKLGGLFYRPLLTTYFSSVYTIFGPNAYAFHFFQVILCIANACLVFILFKHVFSKPLAFILSLVFLVHPINNESAYYISATQEVLFLFFGLIALWILQTFHSQKALIFVSLCIFFSLLSKETGVLFLFISLVYTYLYQRKQFFPLFGYSVTTFIIYLLLRISAIGIVANATKNAPIQTLDLVHRAINIPAIFLFYITTFFFPRDLAAVYGWVYRRIDIQHFYLPLIIDLLFLAVLTFFLLALRKKHHHHYVLYAFFLCWFLVGLLLHMQLLPLDQTVTDQWFYFPMIGLLGMVGVLFRAYRVNLTKRWFVIGVIFIIVLLSVRTFIRGFDWKDDFTLATHDLTVSKEAFSLEHELSRIYLDRGQYQEAKNHALRSISIFPDVFNYTDLANDDFYLGDYAGAKLAYHQALRYGDNFTTYENLSALYINHDNPIEGISFIKNTALKKYPYDAKLWLYLAVLEYNYGNKEDAKAAIQKAYLLNQGIPEVPIAYVAMMNDKPVHYHVGK